MPQLEFDCRLQRRSRSQSRAEPVSTAENGAAAGGPFSLELSFESDSLVTALCGPSGSGKTTVVELLAGLLRPDSGRICLGGEKPFRLVDTADRIWVPLERRRVGVVFQQYFLFPHLTVDRNLRYARSERRPGEDAPHAIEFDAVVDVLELKPLLNRYPAQLSGGEAQRVALGRALLSQPKLLLLDEPVAALDEALKLRVLGYIERVIQHWQIPTLLISHSLAEVRRLAERVVLLDRGRKIAAGSVEDVLGRPSSDTLNRGFGPVNLLRVSTVHQEQGERMGRIGSLLVHLPELETAVPNPSAEKTGVEEAWIQFAPRDVILAAADVSGISSRNHWTGVVRQLIPTEHAVFVAVEVEPQLGTVVWAEVTRQTVAGMGLGVGKSVTCLVKARALQN